MFTSDINITGPRQSQRGQHVKLTCNVSGFRSTPKHIKWYLNGSTIDGNKNIRIVTYQRSDVFSLFSELDITKVNAMHAGNYLCQAVVQTRLKMAKHVLAVDSLMRK